MIFVKPGTTPLLCAGLTTFNTLRHCEALPSDLVAAEGITGLGHLDVPFAKNFGYRVAASRNRFITKSFLCLALTIAWMKAGSAQTPEAATVALAPEPVTVAQTPGPAPAVPPAADNQSSIEMSKQASNPLASLWLMQFQQSNTWLGMPSNRGDRIQSNLQFQPLVSAKLTDDWTLFMRPVLQLFNSTPYQGPTGPFHRTAGFGDTALAFAVSPGPELVGRWLLAAGPTFILPTAMESLLGQNKWQFGPTVAVGYVGEHFLTYAFGQQWFGIGGNGRRTNQMNTYYSFVYVFSNGWSVGTEPNFGVNWEGTKGNKVSFPVGPQVGKLLKCGPLPVKVELQELYYPVRPDVYGPRWDVQLQVTPILPALIKRKLL